MISQNIIFLILGDALMAPSRATLSGLRVFDFFYLRSHSFGEVGYGTRNRRFMDALHSFRRQLTRNRFLICSRLTERKHILKTYLLVHVNHVSAMQAHDHCLAQYQNPEAPEVEFVPPKVRERFAG
jgi:hypothetical protein